MSESKPINPSEAVQPGLFSANELPDVPALVAAAKSYVHTGTTVCRDGERAEAIVRTYLSTGSLSGTARHCCVSPNTIKAVLAVFEASGKLDEVKQRLSTKLGIVAEMATDNMIEKLAANAVPANVLPIMAGVAVEKKALLDGEATSRIEHTEAPPVALADLARYLQSKGVSAPAIDVESTVSSPPTP